jgi:hypothetical protein
MGARLRPRWDDPGVRITLACVALLAGLGALAGCGSSRRVPPALAASLAAEQKAIVHDGLLVAEGTPPPETPMLRDSRKLAALLKDPSLSDTEKTKEINDALVVLVGACDTCVNLLIRLAPTK